MIDRVRRRRPTTVGELALQCPLGPCTCLCLAAADGCGDDVMCSVVATPGASGGIHARDRRRIACERAFAVVRRPFACIVSRAVARRTWTPSFTRI